MHTFTRLERICLLITALVLALMLAVMVRRQDSEVTPKPAAMADDSEIVPSGRSSYGESSSEAEGDWEESGGGESARGVKIPNPSSPSHPVAPPREPGGRESVSTQQVAKAVRMPKVVTTNEIMAALDRVASMPWSPAAEKLLQETMTKWAGIDPKAALEYSLKIESRRVRSALMAGIFSSWAKTDLNGAYEWLVANKEASPDTFRMGIKPVIMEAAARDISGAMNLAMNLSTGSSRLSAVRLVMDQAARSGVAPSLVSYLDSFQTPGERASYAASLAQSWAIYDPQKAAEWALSLTDPSLQNSTMASAVGSWATDNPAAAAEWVLTLPQGDLRNRQVAQVTRSWALYEPVQAADWLLAQHPPSPGLDLAVQGLVGSVVRTDPQGAILWASAISDPRVRSSTIYSACQQWMRNDPQKASVYIATAPLTPAQRARLMRGR